MYETSLVSRAALEGRPNDSSHHSEIGRGTRLLIFSYLRQLPKLNVVGSIPIARSNRACPS
jgi:hypothetical protein